MAPDKPDPSQDPLDTPEAAASDPLSDPALTEQISEDTIIIPVDEPSSGYSVRPRESDDEDFNTEDVEIAGLDTEDVVVLLPTEDAGADSLPDAEVMTEDLETQTADLFSTPGAGFSPGSGPVDSAATEDLDESGDLGFSMTEEVDAEMAGASLLSAHPAFPDAALETEEFEDFTTDDLPELEDVEDITAMVDDGQELVAPVETMTLDPADFGQPVATGGSRRSLLGLAAVMALLVTGVYFGLDFYRDRLESASATVAQKDPNVADAAGPEGNVDPPQTDPNSQDPLPEDPTDESAMTDDPEPANEEAVAQFRTWMGQSLASHFQGTTEKQ